MNLQQAEEMAEAMTTDNEMSISTLGKSGDEVATLLWEALLTTRAEVVRLRKALEDIEGMVSGNLMSGGRPWSDFSKQVQTKARQALEKGE